MVSAQIHRATYTDGSAGSRLSTWAKVLDVSGTFRQLSGSKRYIDSIKQKEIVAKFYCNYRTDIVDTDRLVYGGNTFEITNIKDPNEIHHHLEIELSLKN